MDPLLDETLRTLALTSQISDDTFQPNSSPWPPPYYSSQSIGLVFQPLEICASLEPTGALYSFILCLDNLTGWKIQLIYSSGGSV